MDRMYHPYCPYCGWMMDIIHWFGNNGYELRYTCTFCGHLEKYYE